MIISRNQDFSFYVSGQLGQLPEMRFVKVRTVTVSVQIRRIAIEKGSLSVIRQNQFRKIPVFDIGIAQSTVCLKQDVSDTFRIESTFTFFRESPSWRNQITMLKSLSCFMDILSIREKQKPLRRYQRSRVLFYAMQQKSPRIFGGFVLWMHLSILEINTYFVLFFRTCQYVTVIFL